MVDTWEEAQTTFSILAGIESVVDVHSAKAEDVDEGAPGTTPKCQDVG